MGILANRVLYNKVWTEDYRETFTEEDLNLIESIEVVAGDYGISAKVEMADGDIFFPIHRDSVELSAGDRLDPKQCTIIHLKRGDATTEKLLYNGEPIND